MAWRPCLVEKALNDTRDEGKRVVPVCSMIGTVLKKRPEFDDITDPVHFRYFAVGAVIVDHSLGGELGGAGESPGECRLSYFDLKNPRPC